MPLFRRRLYADLTASAPLAVVCGSRLAGKTTLVRGWLMADPVPGAAVVFVEPPAAPIMPDRYWCHVLAAVRESVCTAGEAAGGLTALRRTLTATRRPVILVLDGAEKVDGVERGVGELLDAAATSRIVVTTRRAEPWNRYAEAGRGRIITENELIFTEREIRVFLQAAAVPPRAPEIRTITDRTGGLPALVSAVCAALRATPARERSTPDRFTALVERAVDLLLRHVIVADPEVSSLSGAVVEAATTAALSRPGARDLVDTLESAGLMECRRVGGEWVRGVPAAVGESLLRSAVSDGTEDLREVRAAAMRYSFGHHEPHTAFVRAIENGYWEHAVEILIAHWSTLCANGFPVIVDAAPVGRLPMRIRDRAHVALRAAGLRSRGDIDDAVAVCDAAGGDTAAALDDADPTSRHIHGFHRLQAGITYLLAGRLDDATVELRRAHTAGAGSFVRRDAAGTLALVHALAGSVPDARDWVVDERTHPPIGGGDAAPVATTSLVASALVALDRLDPRSASGFLAASGTPADSEEFWAFDLYARGQHALLTAMPADGLRRIETEMRRFPRPPRGLPGVLLDTVRAELCLALGDTDAAVRAVAEHAHPFAVAVRARTSLLTGDPGRAEAIVVHHTDDPACPPRVSLELAVIGAAAAAAAGRRADARRHLARAVALSRHNGIIRPFVALAPVMIEGLTHLGVELPVDPSSIAPEFIAFRSTPPVVRLTPRERAVLDALLAGGNTAAIAQSQFVSHNTVKSQLRSLYRKLGVHSRRDAIAAARHLTFG